MNEAAAAGEWLGPWRILEVLGEGASGRVLLARRGDQPDGRQVAIKTLHSPSRAALARFELERQALARLEHPNIARLYDAGVSAAGVPYVVLEHVDGLPIDDYCELHRLGLEERLRLFLEVCRGVQHAHRNLIVHRDLKPANILVDRDGRPRLLDFGIARLLDDAATTGPAAPSAAPTAATDPAAPTQLLGGGTTLLADAVARTPAYASPEQILGQPITTASDVFSLGIVLFELLAGRSPWAGKSSRHELERAICEEDAPAVSRAARKSHPRRARRLAGPLDAILQKALARAPAARYASVEALARDLENHLEHRPIEARPPSVFTTSRLFLRRHLGATLAAAALAAAIGAFLLILARQGAELRAERDKAEQTLAFLIEVFRAGDPGQAGAGERADQLTAGQILGRAAQRIERELEGQPETQATLLGAIGEVYFSIGRYDEAVRLQQLALSRRLALYGGDKLETAMTRFHLAEALVMGGGGPPRAEEQYRAALPVLRRNLPQDAPEIRENLTGLATALELQAKMKEAIDIRQEVVGLTPPTQTGEHLLALGTLANAYSLDREYEEAERVNGEAVELAARSPDRSTAAFADGLFEAAVALSQEGDPRSLPLFERSLAIRRKLLKEDHPRLLESEQALANALFDNERVAEALAIYERVTALKIARLGRDHLLTVPAELSRARCLGELGDWPTAVRLGHEILARAEAAGKKPDDLAYILRFVAGFERQAGDLEAAWTHLLRAEKYVLESGAPRPMLVELMLVQASLEADRGQLAVALGRFELLLGEMGRRFPDGNWRLDHTEAEYARVLALAGRPEEAMSLARRSYDRLAERFGSRSRMLRAPLRALVAAYRARGQAAEAERAGGWLADPGTRPERLGAPELRIPL